MCPTCSTTHGRTCATRRRQKYLGVSEFGRKRMYELFSKRTSELQDLRKLYKCEAESRHCMVAYLPEEEG